MWWQPGRFRVLQRMLITLEYITCLRCCRCRFTFINVFFFYPRHVGIRQEFVLPIPDLSPGMYSSQHPDEVLAFKADCPQSFWRGNHVVDDLSLAGRPPHRSIYQPMANCPLRDFRVRNTLSTIRFKAHYRPRFSVADIAWLTFSHWPVRPGRMPASQWLIVNHANSASEKRCV